MGHLTMLGVPKKGSSSLHRTTLKLCRMEKKEKQKSLNTAPNKPFSYSRSESESNDVMMQFEELSNVHNSDRTSNATRSNLV